MLRRLVPLLAVVGLGLLPSSAQAATCDDYSSQAAAQAAKDTRDADGDGVYCETLPCPCSAAAGGGRESSGPSAAELRRRAARARDLRRRRQINRANAKLVEVVDGDTVKVYLSDLGRRETVRLLGVDTPETKKPGVSIECGGREATHFLLALGFPVPQDDDGDGLYDDEGSEQGVRVRLTTDPTQDLRDRYGRLLAYVDVAEGTPITGGASYEIGTALLVAGWATVYDYEQDGRLRRLDRYKRAQRTAADNDAGVWGSCGGDFHSEQTR